MNELNCWYERREPRRVVDDPRTPSEVDHARVIHSASFRRLQGKTQILDLGDGDFHRTRLTHSLEVGQIALGIVQQLRHRFADAEAAKLLTDPTLIQTVGLIHDLGHPPFGHGGEEVLAGIMRNDGGFEGNGQTLRILSKLEKYSEGQGSNLTRRTLLGAFKYQRSWSEMMAGKTMPELKMSPTGTLLILPEHIPPKCYLDSEKEIVKWLLEPLSQADRDRVVWTGKTGAKTFDCEIVDHADDISYSVHDLEDGIAMGIVTREMFTAEFAPSCWERFLDFNVRRRSENQVSERSAYGEFMDGLFGSGSSRKKQIGSLINYFINEIAVIERPEFESILYRHSIAMSPEARNLLERIKTFILEHVIRSARVQHMRFRGQQMILRVFEALAHDPRQLLPENELVEYRTSDNSMRTICDYVAGGTDQFLIRLYQRMFIPGSGSVFDRL